MPAPALAGVEFVILRKPGEQMHLASIPLWLLWVMASAVCGVIFGIAMKIVSSEKQPVVGLTFAVLYGVVVAILILTHASD